MSDHTKKELTKVTRKLPTFIRHAIMRSKHRAIYKDEYKQVADLIKKIRDDKEEQKKQMEFVW